MKRFTKFAAVCAAAILLFACGDSKEDTSGVNFANTPTGYSIKVNNRTTERLVAFKGELQADKLIGGIPQGESNFGLPKNPALFGQKSEGFALILITEKQYNDNKENLRNLKDTPFTRIFAFYNANGTNESIYEISDRLGGNCSIQIQNLTSLDVELRLNGIYGETLGYARNTMLNTTLYVSSGDYLIFPVFIKYNALRDELVTVYPKGSTGLPWYTQQQLGEDNITQISVDVSELLKGTTYSTGTAWLIIDNQASDTGVQLQKGGVVQCTPMGISTITNGFSRTFQIDMAKVQGTNKYAETANINAYTVGRTGQQISIGNYDLKVDTIYKVTVTGSANAGTIAVSAPVEQGTVDLDDFTQSQ